MLVLRGDHVEQFQKRLIRAFRLDPTLYRELKADESSTDQAGLVVILAAVAAGMASFASEGLSGIAVGTLLALLGWYVWAYLCYAIGTYFLGEAHTGATHAVLLRTLGFASAPGMLRILGFNSALFVPVNLIAGVWMLVAMVIAVQQAFAFTTTWRAVAVCVTGWAIQLLLLLLVLTFIGGDLSPQ
jgi:hypothetical protein